jgi:ABC-type phosphate transport system substrate-binding protein
VLDGPTLGDIWYGNILFWNDTAIKALNPNATLPGERILLAYANDTIAGITQTFMSLLSAANADMGAVWEPYADANWSVLTGIQDHATNTGDPGTAQTTYVVVRAQCNLSRLVLPPPSRWCLNFPL